jgi:hypothetical protein
MVSAYMPANCAVSLATVRHCQPCAIVIREKESISQSLGSNRRQVLPYFDWSFSTRYRAAAVPLLPSVEFELTQALLILATRISDQLHHRNLTLSPPILMFYHVSYESDIVLLVLLHFDENSFGQSSNSLVASDLPALSRLPLSALTKTSICLYPILSKYWLISTLQYAFLSTRH